MNLIRKCFAEFLGTYLLVLFGCGVVHSAVLTGSQSGLWQVAVVWGLAITLAIYITGAASGAHINPAMTLAFATRGRFSWALVPPYILSQLVGGFVAAATLSLFSPFLSAKEQEKHVVRGHPGSEITAMCYGEYFASPGPLASSPGPCSEEAHGQLNNLVSEQAAFFAEALGTLILALAADTPLRGRRLSHTSWDSQERVGEVRSRDAAAIFAVLCIDGRIFATRYIIDAEVLNALREQEK